jgi:hypothetical protein
MTADQQVDYILHDCFFALGQAIGDRKPIDFAAIAWWRARYREKFLTAITVSGNSWDEDRDRVMAVSRWMGHRALVHAADRPSIDSECAAKATADIERGCTMSKQSSTTVM